MDDSNISELLEKYEVFTTNADDANNYLTLLSKFCNEKRVDIIKTVTSVMLRYQHELIIQLNGVVCLDTFFKHNEIEDVDLDTLKGIADALIFIVESYSDDNYMMKISLRILNSLHSINLDENDFYWNRILKAVMNYFVKPRDYDPEVDHLALIICSCLSYFMVYIKPLTFKFPPQYQTKLMSMIRPHAKSKPMDPATSLALSSLVTVISDNLSACEVLTKEDEDVNMFIEMLDTFHDESKLVSTLLAIFYNLLEQVRCFRQQLIQRPIFISKISQLLDSERISVAHEAAGVMAYLLTEMPTRTELLDQLHRVINNWQVPKTEALAEYRSFKPLFSLLQYTNVYPVQLYAAWCIHQTCAREPRIYCWMLKRENGLEILKKLEENKTTHSDVQNLCHKIERVFLDLVESSQNK